MVDLQSAQSALELGYGVQAVMSGTVAKEAQSVRVEAGRAAVALERWTQEAEVAPSGIDVKAPGHDFAGMIIGR